MKPTFQALFPDEPTPADLPQLFDDDQQGPLLAAALLEEFEPSYQAALAELPEHTSPGVRRWLAAASCLDSPQIDAEIDARLADERAPLAVDALVRADIDWYHPRLFELLDDQKARFGAAWLLARSAPDELRDQLYEVDDADHLLEICRAVSLSGDSGWFPTLLGLRRDLEPELSDRQRQALDAAVATIEPHRFARALLHGDVETEWLGDDRLVADFLSRRGTSPWVDALAIFRETRDREAFDLAALFAVTTVLTDPFEDLPDDGLDPLDARQWVDDTPQRVAFHLGICEDDELAIHLVASTLHQSLIERGIQPPPLPGLPLSGPPPTADELDEALQRLRTFSVDNTQQRVALIRSLTDLVALVRQGALSPAQALPILDEFAPLHGAAKRVRALLAEDLPLGRLDDWGSRGIHYATWHLLAERSSALTELARGWIDGPLERAPLFAAIFSARFEINVV